MYYIYIYVQVQLHVCLGTSCASACMYWHVVHVFTRGHGFAHTSVFCACLFTFVCLSLFASVCVFEYMSMFECACVCAHALLPKIVTHVLFVM